MWAEHLRKEMRNDGCIEKEAEPCLGLEKGLALPAKVFQEDNRNEFIAYKYKLEAFF